jgi:hypothetical protein
VVQLEDCEVTPEVIYYALQDNLKPFNTLLNNLKDDDDALELLMAMLCCIGQMSQAGELMPAQLCSRALLANGKRPALIAALELMTCALVKPAGGGVWALQQQGKRCQQAGGLHC